MLPAELAKTSPGTPASFAPTTLALFFASKRATTAVASPFLTRTGTSAVFVPYGTFTVSIVSSIVDSSTSVSPTTRSIEGSFTGLIASLVPVEVSSPAMLSV